jgi:competence protein ComEC
MGAGIAIYFALPMEPPTSWAVAATLVAVASGFALRGRQRTVVRVGLSVLAAASLGFAMAKLRTELVAAPILSRRVGPLGIDGRIEQAELRGKGYRIVLGQLHIRKLTALETPARVRISLKAGTTLPLPGSWWHVTAVLMPPPAPAAPGAYDFGRAAYFMRLGAVGYAYGRLTRIEKGDDGSILEQASLVVERLRARITERIHSVLPGSTGGIVSALITGNRSAISDNDEEALRDAGLAHVLAIAGLHMALVGLGLFWVVRAAFAAIPTVALRWPIKKLAAAAALFSTTFYLGISGATSASTRAFVMLAMMLVSIIFDRPALSMRSLALAATIILMLGPESILEPGFQMSFAAVMSLIAIAEWEASRKRQNDGASQPILRHVRRYLRGIAVTSLVGSLATIPFAIFHFNRATHYAVLGNLLAMPVMGFVVMPFAALSVLLMPVGLDAGPLHITAWGVGFMLAVGRWVSSLPGAVSVMPAWPTAALSLVALGGLWLGLWRRRLRWLGVALFLAGLAIAYGSRQPDILIGRDGATVAIRLANGTLKLLEPAKDSYSADEWLKRDGDPRVADNAVADASDGVLFDSMGCIAIARGRTRVAEVFRPEALAEDCVDADVVISKAPVRKNCSGPRLVIDPSAMARGNGYAIWLETPIRWQTVEQFRGRRPWSAQERPQKAQYRRINPTSLP